MSSSNYRRIPVSLTDWLTDLLTYQRELSTNYLRDGKDMDLKDPYSSSLIPPQLHQLDDNSPTVSGQHRVVGRSV